MLAVLSLTSTVLVIATGWILGLRLLRLAWQTKALPERLVGFALFTITGLGYPLVILGQSVPGMPPRLASTFVVLSGTTVHLGLLAVFLFTFKVFRPDSAWAARVVWLAVLLCPVTSSGYVYTTFFEPDHVYIQTAYLMVVAGIAYGWAGAESIAYYRLLRRRMRLDLGDPVVTNRFFLWGLANLASLLVCVVNFYYALMHPLAVLHPVALVVAGLVGLIRAPALFVAFMPPAFYLRYLNTAGSAGSAQASPSAGD